MIYQWRESYPLAGDAQAAGEELERIRIQSGGELRSDDVIDAARSHNAVLHQYFEWDNTKAAHAHRIDQARKLIGSIEVVVEQVASKAPTRAFVSVVKNENRAYSTVGDALADPDLRSQVLSQAWRELEAWRKRHAELIELVKVFAIIDEARPA